MSDLDKLFSDEMLAAYIEGNATPIEKNIIDEYLNMDDLVEVLDIVSDIKTSPELLESGEILDAENVDSVISNTEPTLQELKHEIENKNQHIM